MAFLKVLILGFACLSFANKIDHYLNTCEAEIKNLLDTANRHGSKSRRGRLAITAANDAYKRAQKAKLRSGTPSHLLGELEKNYEHHKHYENKFRQWGGYDNAYAEYIHRESAEFFYQARQNIYDAMTTLDLSESKLDLVLLYSNQGGSAGEFLQKVEVGYKSTETIDNKISHQITSGLDVLLGPVTMKFGYQFATEMASSFYTENYEYNTQTIKIDLSKPAYVYQLVGNFVSEAEHGYTIKGNYRIYT